MKEEEREASNVVRPLRTVPHGENRDVFPDETGLPVARVWVRLDERRSESQLQA